MLNKILTLLLGFVLIAGSAAENDAELLSLETEISVTGGKVTTSHLFRILINNRNGEIYTHVEIPVSTLSRISKIRGQIRDAGGRTVEKLKNSDITRRAAYSGTSFHTDNEVVEFTLKHNQYPYIIEYSYQLQKTDFVYLTYWMPVLRHDIPTLNATLKAEIPAGYRISYRYKNTGEMNFGTQSDPRIYYWKASYDGQLEEEVFAPPVEDFFPTVAIVPEHFRFDSEGSLKSWTDYGNWQFKLVEQSDDLPDKEKMKITTLIAKAENDYEKVRTLYHYLQDETRYIDIYIETGGLKPYPASYVCDNKYGDCKALTNYFRSVLNFAGIDAFYTKVYAGNPINEIEKGFPAQQFNHVILFVPLQQDSLWLDCTSKGPFDYAGTFIQNRDALVIEKDRSRFLRTPALTLAEVLEARKITVSYRVENAEVSVMNVFRGKKFELYAMLERDYTPGRQQDIIRELSAGDGFTLTGFEFMERDRDQKSLNLKFEAVSDAVCEVYGNDLLMRNIPVSIPQFEKPGTRKLPVKLSYPVYKSDTIVYEIPAEYEVATLPEDTKLTGRFGEYSISVAKNENSIEMVKSMIIYRGEYPLDAYEDFYRYIASIRENENKAHILLTKK